MSNSNYFGARILRGKKRRMLYFHASHIRVENGDLLLFMTRDGGEEYLYRAFARGAWQDVFAAHGLTGHELHEEHDVDETTGKDDRMPPQSPQ
jgi:hypothetical protein